MQYRETANARPKKRASGLKPWSGRREIGGTRQRVPNASTRYQDTLTGL
jgi:hypothetical protein